MYSEKEIEKSIEEHFKKISSWNRPDSIEVCITGDSASIVIARMYDFVEFDFELLEMLSKIFNTKKINVGDRYSRPGCETCDHGSSYRLNFSVDKIGSTKKND